MRRLLAFSGLLLLGCYEAPFERVNLADPLADVAISLTSTRDTVTPSDPWVAFKVVTDPAFEGYTVFWTASPAVSGLVHQGNGVFRLTNIPTSPIRIEVTARILSRTVKGTVILAADP